MSEDRIIGDFDGDRRTDITGFYEDTEGHLVVAVYLRAALEPKIIWGGDIASTPFYTIRAASAGVYHTDCEAYGPDCGGAPTSVTLTHDGVIVEGLEDHSRTLYYWAEGEFKNVSIRE